MSAAIRLQSRLLLLALSIFSFGHAIGQLERTVNQPVQPGGAPIQIDSNLHNTNTAKWNDEKIRVYWQLPFSSFRHQPDTAIHRFHKRNILPPTYHNLGNSGTASYPLLFQAYNNNGPTLGYHAHNLLLFDVDSVRYYNTTRPYSLFHYELGSKQEQQAQILHSQNITPDWNFTFRYRKIGSPGFYKIQRTNNDNASINSEYLSPRKRYHLYAAGVYNKLQQDENGGIVSDSFFNNPLYEERALIPVKFQNDGYSTKRSAIQNVMRQYAIKLQHAYTLGKGDTIYNADSTQFDYKLESRFRILHQAELSSSQHRYEDFAPDSTAYLPLLTANFAPGDSVIMRQKWLKVDNHFQLSGFVGKAENQVSLSAGLGIRYDRFESWDTLRRDNRQTISNYIIGGLQREGQENKWDYNAFARLYFTGTSAGDFTVNARIARKVKSWGNIFVSLDQQLNSAPYNYQYFKLSIYENRQDDFQKESISKISGGLEWVNAGLRIEAANYTIANYFYLNDKLAAAQSSGLFNVFQIQARYQFKWRILVLDNYVAIQQPTALAPVNLPAFSNWHQLSIEARVFKDALAIATGIEAGWHAPYQAAGYSPLLARYFNQQSTTTDNGPYVSAFFNFKVKKRFRCYIMGDQLQQLWSRNLIFAPDYPYPNAMLRFGFSWAMIN